MDEDPEEYRLYYVRCIIYNSDCVSDVFTYNCFWNGPELSSFPIEALPMKKECHKKKTVFQCSYFLGQNTCEDYESLISLESLIGNLGCFWDINGEGSNTICQNKECGDINLSNSVFK
jgi:hypothetical protein